MGSAIYFFKEKNSRPPLTPLPPSLPLSFTLSLSNHFFFRPSTHRCLWSASLVTTPSRPALRIPSSRS